MLSHDIIALNVDGYNMHVWAHVCYVWTEHIHMSQNLVKLYEETLKYYLRDHIKGLVNVRGNSTLKQLKFVWVYSKNSYFVHRAPSMIRTST